MWFLDASVWGQRNCPSQITSQNPQWFVHTDYNALTRGSMQARCAGSITGARQASGWQRAPHEHGANTGSRLSSVRPGWPGNEGSRSERTATKACLLTQCLLHYPQLVVHAPRKLPTPRHSPRHHSINIYWQDKLNPWKAWWYCLR